MTDQPNTRRTILIVEADAASRALFSDLLSRYSLTFAANAFEAVRSVNARPFHAYLLDYWLPDWSGVQLCRAIRDGERLLRQLRIQLELSELKSLRARDEEERAIQQELERRLRNTVARVEAAKELARASLERTARTKAYKAFIAAHGTRVHFESWWPNMFGSARAARGVIADPSAGKSATH